MIVDYCAQQIVCSCYGVHIAREMKIYVLHRYYLSVTAAGSTALYSENRAHRRLTQGYYSFFAYAVHRFAETYRDGGFSFTCRRRIYGCYKYELAVLFVFIFFEQRQRKLCFVFAVKFKLVGTDAELFGNVGYRLNVGLFCYFDIS